MSGGRDSPRKSRQIVLVFLCEVNNHRRIELFESAFCPRSRTKSGVFSKLAGSDSCAPYHLRTSEGFLHLLQKKRTEATGSCPLVDPFGSEESSSLTS